VTHASPRHARLQADLILLLVAAIWGSAFAAQRVAALHMDAFLFNGLRFLLGALVLLPLAWRSRGRAGHLKRGEIPGIVLAGLLLFGGISFQQVGLRYTTASNAGFITGLYVVFIPLILMAGRSGLPRPAVWIAAGLAAAGLFLLSTGGTLRLAEGDALELACAVLWAFHVIWIGRLVQRTNALWVALGQDLVCGLLSLGMHARPAALGVHAGSTSLGVGLALEGGVFPPSLEAWWAVAYTGVFSIAIGYTLQAVGQRVAPPADAAIILSLEAVFAATFGWLLLGERLSAVQLAGCGLMLAGMVLAQLRGR
jgi:drug/metabolite transporter (DMT)-like permease